MDENKANIEKNETNQEEKTNTSKQPYDGNSNKESKSYTNYEQNNRIYTHEKNLNTMAVVGFISSLIFFLPFTDLAGLMISIVGLKNVAKKDEGGSGLAIAGIVISSLRLAFSIFVFVIFIIAFVKTNKYYNWI